MIQALLVFKLQLTSHLDGGILYFANMAAPWEIKIQNPISMTNLVLLGESQPKYP